MSHFKGPDLNALSGFNSNSSVLKILVDALRKNGNATVLVEGQTGKTVTRAEYLRLSSSISAELRSLGISAGDYVAICCEKSVLSYSLLLGTMLSGASAVLIPTPHADIVHQLTKGHYVKAVFYDDEYRDAVSSSVGQLNPKPLLEAVVDPEDPTMATLINSTRQLPVFAVKDVKKHVPIILFSSGTTGEPKGIEIPDIAVQLSGAQFLHKQQLTSLFVASPLFWYSGMFTWVAAVTHSFPLVMSTSRDMKDNLQIMEKYRVQSAFMSTGSMTHYISEPSLKEFDLSSLTKVFVAGELVLKSVVKTFISEVLGDKGSIEIILGMTEVGILSACSQEQLLNEVKVGICGKLNPGVEIKILDEKGLPLPPGSLGELWVKVMSVTSGYWGRQDLLDSLLDGEGFFQTGDAGFFDADGILFLRGRVGDLVNFRGTKIPPADIENILLGHPEVVDAAVVGKAHPTDVQHATAFVVRKPGSDVSESDIAAFINGQVDDSRRLRGGVHFRESLPRVAVGKIRRKLLR